MRKILFAFAVAALATALSAPQVFAAKKKDLSGEELFKQHCAACHPSGGNIMKKDFTLSKRDREEHGVKTAGDIVNKMRNPGPGMTKFDKKMLPDSDAKKIADYIIKTFK